MTAPTEPRPGAAQAAAELTADVLVVGGGLGGLAAALAAADAGCSVVVTEPTTWIGGQLTSQLVPLDEHRHIEWTGANRSYRRFREGVREHYRRWFPLTDAARADPLLNPGASWVSPVAHDPRVGKAVLEAMLAPHLATGRITLLLEHEPIAAARTGDRIDGVTFRGPDRTVTVTAAFVLDATETGELLPLAGIDHVSGRESRDDTGEPNADETADPTDMQSVTWCFAIDHVDGTHTIDKPALYDEMSAWQPPAWGGANILSFGGPLQPGKEPREYVLRPNPGDDPFTVDTDHRNMANPVDLWTYRRIVARRQLRPGAAASDVTVVNWVMNDYVGGPVYDVLDGDEHRYRAKQLSLSLLYWLQTAAPRPDGGTGWPGLRLRADVAGTADGLAMAPYIRESRRVRALETIREQDISTTLRDAPKVYPDSVGVGHYFWLDRHASSRGRRGAGGVPWPFEIPLGALIPRGTTNLLAAAKNIGTTQITNGSYRLHPVEWAVGEAAGTLAVHCLQSGITPHQVHGSPARVDDLQRRLRQRGVQLHWPARITP